MVHAGRVVSTPFEHVSIASTLKTRFGIRSLNARMDAASNLLGVHRPGARRRHPGLDVRVALADGGFAGALGAGAPSTARASPRCTGSRAGGAPLHHLDMRTPYERVASWLRHAQELEAVRVVG